MLRPPGVSSASRHLARAAPCIENEPYLPLLTHARRDSVDRPFEMRGKLGIRCVREEPEGVEDLLLLRAEIMGCPSVCP
jgi:hypothetical protein